MGERENRFKMTLATTAIAGGGLCFFSIILTSGTQETLPQRIPGGPDLGSSTQEVSPSTTEVFKFQQPLPPNESSEGWDCGQFAQGEITTNKIKKKLMKLVDPHKIEPGPYRLTHLDGSVQIIEDRREFPKVFPGETLCVRYHGRGFHPGESIFEATKHQNIVFSQRSVDIQAAIRSKQGF